MKKEKREVNIKKETHKRHGWLWFFIILLLAGGIVWLLQERGVIDFGSIKQYFAKEEVITESVAEQQPVETVSTETEQVEIRPACAIVEDLLLQYVCSETEPAAERQYAAVHIYEVLAQRGCPENAQLFSDLAMRRKTIADGLVAAAYGFEDDAMTSADYLYSDEKICETIENRVMRNINTQAYTYSDFLENAKTYATLYEYGCCDNKAAYMRAAVRELGVAVALMPTDKMDRDEIITVVEICKSLRVADAAHLMLQRLKARGYDTEFLLEMENIIHSIR